MPDYRRDGGDCLLSTAMIGRSNAAITAAPSAPENSGTDWST